MQGGVVLEFGCREEIKPGSRVVGAKDMEICFYFLIGAFGLSISLRVIRGGEFDIILEESGQFSSEGGSELGSSIGYQGVM